MGGTLAFYFIFIISPLVSLTEAQTFFKAWMNIMKITFGNKGIAGVEELLIDALSSIRSNKINEADIKVDTALELVRSIINDSDAIPFRIRESPSPTS